MSINYTGLSSEQVADNRQKFGANVIQFPMHPSLKDKITMVNQAWQIRLLVGINISILLFISFINMMRIDIVNIWTIFLIFLVLLVFSYLIILMSAHWNDKENVLEISPLVNVWILLLAISGIFAFYQTIYNNESGFSTYLPTLMIAMAMLIITGISCWIEHSNIRLFRQITQQKNQREVKVIRNGNVVIVPRKEVVVHDVIILQKGDEIPADGYILDSCNLKVNESLFTGQPQCHKSADHADYDFDAMFSTDYLLGSSWVLEGEAIMEVKAVGDHTVAASPIRHHDSEDIVNAYLQMSLAPLNKGIAKISYFIATLIVLCRVAIYFTDISTISSFTTASWIPAVYYMINTILIAITLLIIVVSDRLFSSLIINCAFRTSK